MFKKCFEALDIKEYVKSLVDYREDIRLYSGFLVVGNRAEGDFWHMDYSPGANAYTLITPLFEPDPGHGNLLYKDPNDDTKTHIYKLGEGIFVGDHFLHATEPYRQTATTRVLLSMTFGTDKFDHWEALKQTIAGQSDFMVLPCGHQMGMCQCLEDFETKQGAPLINSFEPPASRNELCPCGSGKRFKHCHGR